MLTKFAKPGCFGPILTNFVYLATLIDDTTQTDVFKPPLIYLKTNFVNPGFDPEKRKPFKRVPKGNEIRGFVQFDIFFYPEVCDIKFVIKFHFERLSV